MNLTYYELKEWFKNHQLKYYSKEFDLEFDVNKIDDLFYFVFDNFLYNDKYENELKKQNFKFDSNTVRNIINIYKNNNSKTKIFFIGENAKNSLSSFKRHYKGEYTIYEKNDYKIEITLSSEDIFNYSLLKNKDCLIIILTKSNFILYDDYDYKFTLNIDNCCGKYEALGSLNDISIQDFLLANLIYRFDNFTINNICDNINCVLLKDIISKCIIFDEKYDYIDLYLFDNIRTIFNSNNIKYLKNFKYKFLNTIKLSTIKIQAKAPDIYRFIYKRKNKKIIFNNYKINKNNERSIYSLLKRIALHYQNDNQNRLSCAKSNIEKEIFICYNTIKKMMKSNISYIVIKTDKTFDINKIKETLGIIYDDDFPIYNKYNTYAFPIYIKKFKTENFKDNLDPLDCYTIINPNKIKIYCNNDLLYSSEYLSISDYYVLSDLLGYMIDVFFYSVVFYNLSFVSEDLVNKVLKNIDKPLLKSIDINLIMLQHYKPKFSIRGIVEALKIALLKYETNEIMDYSIIEFLEEKKYYV